MRFTGLRRRLGTRAVRDAGEWEEITELGGVDHERRPEEQELSTVEVDRSDGLDSIAGHADRDRLQASKDLQVTRLHIRREQAFDRRDRDGRLEGEMRHPARAGVAACLPRIEAERLVVGSDRPAQPVVARRASKALDQIVLVERGDSLRGELPAEPVGLFEEARPATAPGGSEGGCNAARASPDDQDLALDLAQGHGPGHTHDRRRSGAGSRARVGCRRPPRAVARGARVRLVLASVPAMLLASDALW